MRTMPSVTLTTVPTLRASAADWNFSMRALIRSLISDALMDIKPLPCQFGSEPFQTAFQRSVDDQIPRANHRAAQQRRVHRILHAHPALQSRLKRLAQLVGLGGA